NQYEKWSFSPHSKAFTVLATEHALKVAQDAGIKSNPQEAAECLKCHVTAYSAPASAKAESFSPDEGVGCEACHGPGSIYKSLNIMKALHAGTQDAEAVGFIHGGKETCLTCHNEKSPTYKPFKFEAFMKEIAHPIPEKE
ncbi:cytochrome C554, partial [candidate division KSB1 bacterium]|nr:cytochrome C554 [candidate division KSB1 bacterium]